MAKHCGAKTRAGGTCQQAAKPNGRCRFHGGLSTGPKIPNTAGNALKHGIYATRFTEEELKLARELKLGNVDDELRLMRVRLRRALEVEHQAAGEPELEEIIERDISENVGARREEKRRVRNYADLVDRTISRIESLEKTRLILRTELGIDPEEMDADRLTPGAPDEPTPASQVR